MSHSKKGRGRFIFCLSVPARLVSWLRNKRTNSETSSAISISRNYSIRSDRSSSSGDKDLAELIRIAAQEKAAKQLKVARSQSMAVCRIDEEAPCEFNESNFDGVFSRSKSYAIGNALPVVPRRRYRYS